MNMRTKSRPRWRKNAKRGVSPIIATILLVAITVVLAAVLYILISGLTKGPGNTPLGTALALGTPLEAAKGTNFWYNFSVQSAGGNLILNNLQFQVQTPSGGIVPAGGSWTLNVLGLTGTTIGTYSMSTNAWTLGGTTTVSSQQQVSLNSVSSNLSGDTLIVIGTGSFQGSISVSIP